MRRAGALATAVFALAWALTGTYGIEDAAVASRCRAVAVAVTVLAIVAAARRSGGLPGSTSGRVPADWRRRFNIIGAVQLGAIAVVVALAVAAGVPGLVPAAVCLVVGGHFFPLATAFAQPQYRTTGAALCATAAAGTVAFVTGGDAASAVVVGAGAALALWVTSLHVSLARG